MTTKYQPATPLPWREFAPGWADVFGHVPYSWGSNWAAPGEGPEVARQCRVLALCLFAAMVEGGDV